MTQVPTQTRSPRKSWRKPEVVRLEAGLAESFAITDFDGVANPPNQS